MYQKENSPYPYFFLNLVQYFLLEYVWFIGSVYQDLYDMSREIQNLLFSLKDLRDKLQNSLNQTTEAANIASELSNEWWMETAMELDDYSIRIRNIIDDLDATIDEGKTMFEDYEERERTLRKPDDDEENLEWKEEEDVVDKTYWREKNRERGATF
jgi:hypothetical protein